MQLQRGSGLTDANKLEDVCVLLILFGLHIMSVWWGSFYINRGLGTTRHATQLTSYDSVCLSVPSEVGSVTMVTV